MAKVTTVILAFSSAEDSYSNDRIPLGRVNLFFMGDGGIDPETGEVTPKASRGRGFVQPPETDGWYGGTKFLEPSLFVASFNYLREKEFLDHLIGLGWKEPQNAQVMIQGENEDCFRVYTVAQLRVLATPLRPKASAPPV